MAEITEAQLKAGLSSIEDSRRSRQRIPQREILAKRFRHGINGRRKALEQLATIAQPYTPTFITLDTPLRIWANRFAPDSNEPLGTDILVDSHIAPLNNSAKILLNYSADASFTDRLNFYFFWRNEKGGDAVVNVTSYLTLNGSCKVHAKSSLLHGLVAPNFSQVSVDAKLSVFEWWNEPPTEPLSEAGQLQNVTSVKAVGGEFSDDSNSMLVSANCLLTYNIFSIPSNAVAVFEVGLSLTWAVAGGDLNVDFSFEDNLVWCPYLQLEVLPVPIVASSNF